MSVAVHTARLFALIVGAGALGGIVVPAFVAGAPGPTAVSGSGSAALTLPALRAAPELPASAPERQAISLLRRAASAGNDRGYSGTQFVTSWSTAGTSSVVVDLQHMAGRGVLVRLAAARGSSAVDDAGAATLDARALAVLERHYVLSVATRGGQCAGRPARIVEARPRGASAVAGRFWLDVATGLVLRRELYDGTGHTVRAAAFVDLQMSTPKPWTGSTHKAAADAAADGGSPVDSQELSKLRRQGWRAPGRLAGGMELFDARSHEAVLHLSYTDGLFAVSVFSQAGRLNPDSVKGWQHASMAGTPAWTRPGLSQRVVWAGGGWVYTAVADAPDSVVATAVAAFPATGRDSFGRRIARGLHRMGSWVNPTR